MSWSTLPSMRFHVWPVVDMVWMDNMIGSHELLASFVPFVN